MSFYGRPRGGENNGGGGLSYYRPRGGFGEIPYKHHSGRGGSGGGGYYGDRGGGGDLPRKYPASYQHRGDGGRGGGGGRGYDRGGPGRGRGGPGGGGRGGRHGGGGGRGGSRAPDLSDIKRVKSNIILSTISSSFSFYMYTTSCMKNATTAMDSRRRRLFLFNKAIFDTLLKDMPKGEKKQLRDVTFFQGSYFFSARPIPGLEPAKLPLKEPLYTSEGGETFTVKQVFHFVRPQCFDFISKETMKDEVAFDCRCSQCPRKAFGSVEDLLTHCQQSKHTPMYATQDPKTGTQIPDENTFLQYANVVLQKALGSTGILAPWGKDFIDPRNPQEPTNWGKPLGILVFRAFNCEFGYVRGTRFQKAHLALTVDLRAKIMRNKSVLDELCDGRDPSTVQFTPRDQERANQHWSGQVVIYKLDKKTYFVKSLLFDHSAETLPVEGLGMNHAEYFRTRKKHLLKYPRARPMVEVQGRRNESIYFPAELVCGNELDPSVREQLPKVASYEPKERDKAVNEMVGFIGNNKDILASCGIILTNPNDKTKANFLPAKAVVLKAPQLVARGIPIPERYKDNWTNEMQKAWFKTPEPRNGVKLKVVLFHNDTVDDRGAMTVFRQIRTFVGTFNAPFDFEDEPHAVKSFRAFDDARDQMDKMNELFKRDVPSNIFVLNFIRPRSKNDPSYPIIKHLLGCNGYLSQFVSFKTFDHARRLDDRGVKKSKMILQGVARQILQKSGVRLWWVSLPPELPLPAVFVGVDIFHAPRQYSREHGGRVRKPSCAAIVIEVLRRDSEQTQKVEIYSETYTLEGGQEAGLMEPLRRTVQQAMKVLNVNPMSCIVWRDGISESSFNSWAKQEIRGIQEGLKAAGDLTAEYVPIQGSHYGPSMLEAPPVASMPGHVSSSTAALKREAENVQSGAVVVKKEVKDVPIAYVICQKRIATKFLTEGGELDGQWGAPAGTLVDGIQGLKDYKTFYIQGRAPPGSTPKPVRYITIQQDDELKSLGIPKLTWDMCHDYPNWTGPIKVPSVCMCAHKLAELAGTMPRDGGNDIAHRRFKNTMHFL